MGIVTDWSGLVQIINDAVNNNQILNNLQLKQAISEELRAKPVLSNTEIAELQSCINTYHGLMSDIKLVSEKIHSKTNNQKSIVERAKRYIKRKIHKMSYSEYINQFLDAQYATWRDEHVKNSFVRLHATLLQFRSKVTAALHIPIIRKYYNTDGQEIDSEISYIAQISTSGHVDIRGFTVIGDDKQYLQFIDDLFKSSNIQNMFDKQKSALISTLNRGVVSEALGVYAEENGGAVENLSLEKTKQIVSQYLVSGKFDTMNNILIGDFFTIVNGEVKNIDLKSNAANTGSLSAWIYFFESLIKNNTVEFVLSYLMQDLDKYRKIRLQALGNEIKQTLGSNH